MGGQMLLSHIMTSNFGYNCFLYHNLSNSVGVLNLKNVLANVFYEVELSPVSGGKFHRPNVR